MNKNILTEMTELFNITCVDLLVNSKVQVSGTFNVQSLGVANDFYKDKLVKIYLPAGNYSILNVTDTTLELDYKLSFEIQQEPVVPPATPLPPIIITSTQNLVLKLQEPIIANIPDRKILPVSMGLSFIVTGNTNTTISFGAIIDRDVSVNLQRNLEMETLLNSFISSLNSANPKIYTKYECPTNNDFFLKYDEFTDIMIGYKNCYKDENAINSKIGELNTFLELPSNTYKTKIEIQSFFNIYTTKINFIYLMIDDWVIYFDRLKKLMSKIRISDSKVQGEEYQNMYDAKPTESQTIIDSIYSVYENSGQEQYAIHKQDLLYEIKI